MNKSQLVEHIATSADISKDQAGSALNALVEGISTTLANGDDVSILGFGSFKVNTRAARTGRNPRTGEEIQISASKTPAFKAGKALKEACNLEHSKTTRKVTMTTPKEKAKTSRSKKAGKSTKAQAEGPKARQRIEELLEERELAKLLEL